MEKVCSLRSSGTNKDANSTMLIPLLPLEASLSSSVVCDTCWFLLLPEVAKHLWGLGCFCGLSSQPWKLIAPTLVETSILAENF